jgi:hypothetical protein
MKNKKATPKVNHEQSTPRIAKTLLSSKRDVMPDDVTRHYYDLGVKLNITIIKPKEPDVKPTVVVEGDQTTLLFLADLLLSHVADLDCGYALRSTAFFTQQSEYGLYFHKLPCLHEPPVSGAVPASE